MDENTLGETTKAQSIEAVADTAVVGDIAAALLTVRRIEAKDLAIITGITTVKAIADAAGADQGIRWVRMKLAAGNLEGLHDLVHGPNAPEKDTTATNITPVIGVDQGCRRPKRTVRTGPLKLC